MPVIIPKELPAFSLLERDVFVMDTARAAQQDIRPLELLIVNLMPVKEQAEAQLLSLLANSPLQIKITLLRTASYVGKNTSYEHLEQFYTELALVRGRFFDAAIITGAPVETMDFCEVSYWSEMVEIMDFLRERTTSSMYLCWGAMAALHHFYGLRKVALGEKLFGVYEHEKAEDALLMGLGDRVSMPHSRHSGMEFGGVLEGGAGGGTLADGASNGLKLLLGSAKTGPAFLRDERDFYMLAHPEYDKLALWREWQRDKELGQARPENYFKEGSRDALGNGSRDALGDAAKHDEEGICFSWRSDASVIFSNWINYVYQKTPYEL